MSCLRFLACALLLLVAPFARVTAEPPADTAAPVAVPLRYDMNIEIEPQDGEAKVQARVMLRNAGTSPLASIDVLLYRLSNIESVSIAGSIASYTDALIGLREYPYLQFRRVRVTPSDPLPPGQVLEIALGYSLALRGYPEVLGYLKESIGPDYSLLRPETAYYPLVAGDSWADYLAAQAWPVDYSLSVDTPAGYAVASGGRSVSTDTTGARTIHRFASRAPTTRIDAAIARFERIEHDGVVVDALPAQVTGARAMVDQLAAARRYFESRLGAHHAGVFHVIQIPEDHGSQAGDGYLLQDGAVFTDATRMHEVFHEVAHGWRIRTTPELARTRWFDEAVASYLEISATRKLLGDAAAAQLANGLRTRFVGLAGKRPGLADAAFRDYGTLEFGDASYGKGAWSLLVLEQLVGESGVDQVLRKLLERPMVRSFDELAAAIRETCSARCDRYLAEWFEQGTTSTRFMLGADSASGLAAGYQANIEAP